MATERYHGQAAGRCRAVSHGSLVYAVATDPSDSEEIVEQTKRTLETLEMTLVEAGSSKTRLLQATVYLRDITMKAEMDAVWCDWISDKECWPQRACIEANPGGACLVEIVVTAAAA